MTWQASCISIRDYRSRTPPFLHFMNSSQQVWNNDEALMKPGNYVRARSNNAKLSGYCEIIVQVNSLDFACKVD